MSNQIKRFSLLAATLLCGLLVSIVFLQINRASAAQADAMQPAKIAAAPEDIPGLGAWVVTANLSDASLNVVNTVDDRVFGPFLEGQLGPGWGGLLDITFLPDRTTAMVSNFWERSVHFVDFSDPLNPTWIVSTTVPMHAEDLDLTEDGRYALVTDGSFSSLVDVIDTVARSSVYTLNLGTKQAQAVEIAPDGTAVLVDFYGGEIHTLVVGNGGMITHTNSYTNFLPSPAGNITISTPGGPISGFLNLPVNVGIAPDGQTVIVCNAFTTTLNVYRIVAPGELEPTGTVPGLHGSFQPPGPMNGPGTQSVAFNHAGDKAYVTINSRSNLSGTFADQLAVLNILGPGQVTLDIPEAATLPRYTNGQFFGVDTLVVVGEKAYLGYQTDGVLTGTNALAVVDLFSFSTYTLTVGDTSGETPAGVAVMPVNLYLNKSSSVLHAAPGEIVDYTIELLALGPQVAGVALEDLLPPGLEFVGPVTIDPPSAGVPDMPPVIAHNLVVPSRQLVSVTFPVRVLDIPDGVAVLNTAHAFSPELSRPATAETFFVMDWPKVYLPMLLR